MIKCVFKPIFYTSKAGPICDRKKSIDFNYVLQWDNWDTVGIPVFKGQT